MGPILVTGGTGTLGRHVVRRLGNAKHDVRVLTRQAGKHADDVAFVTGDLLSNTGVDAAVDGVTTIIHCAGSQKGDDVATQNLVRAAARAGRPHLVYISVVGAERIPISSRLDRMMFSYYDMKRKAEQTVEHSELPWTTLRATQFHDLIFTLVSTLAKSPVVPVLSGVAFQPVDSDEVAARLVELALDPPSGLVPGMAGPRTYTMRDLIRGYLERTHRHAEHEVQPLLLHLHEEPNSATGGRYGRQANGRQRGTEAAGGARCARTDQTASETGGTTGSTQQRTEADENASHQEKLDLKREGTQDPLTENTPETRPGSRDADSTDQERFPRRKD